jgi:hypothetical protein
MSDWSTNNRTYTDNESKTLVEIYPKNDGNVRSQISPLVLPVFCSPPTRNGGYTFFADGKDYEAYDSLQPNDKALSFLDQASLPKIYSQVKSKTKKLWEIDSKGIQGQWMFFDSGASRSVINSESPLRSLLSRVEPTTGSCTVGSGVKLPYIESGLLMDHNPVTVVEGLQFDLYSAVAAAKQGTSAVIDFDLATGENKSFTFCKQTGEASPLIERKQGVLEIPMHLYMTEEKGLITAESRTFPTLYPPETNGRMVPLPRAPQQPIKRPYTTLKSMRPYHVAAFWSAFDTPDLSLSKRENNHSQLLLFTYDVVKSLNDQERDFLIHARLAHLPSKQIIKLIQQGNLGLPFSGKFTELCRPCLEARHKAHAKHKHSTRNEGGKIGEHLHSDLAIVSTVDFQGFKYVLTVVDEISDEVVVVLLKDKTGNTVLEGCKRAHALITSRSKSTLKTWQFDRGTEFMNKEFDIWIHQELGAKQLFSNVEHPWENGRAERSFQTIFAKARSMLKHADLPNFIWGKAVLHAVFLKNRSPSTRTVVSPLQFRTGTPFNFNKLRVFGCPAQIFIRPSARTNPKLSDRSEKGIFVGMSVRGNGFIFLVHRTKTILEVDSKDVLFNETFSDCRDRHGKIVPNGAVLQPDLHEASDFDSSYVQDGIAAHPRYAIASNSINPFAPLADNDEPAPEKDESSPDKDDPDDSHDSPNEIQKETPTTIPHAPDKVLDKPPKPSKFWHYEPIPAIDNVRGDRRNDGPKSKEFFQVLPSKRSVSRPAEPNSPPTATLQALSAQASPSSSRELDVLLSCMESRVSPDLCVLLTQRSTDLHYAFASVFYDGPDPKSQKEIDRMPPIHAKRYNDASIAEFTGMKRKHVMELVPRSAFPTDTFIFPSVVNWTTKKVLGVYSKTKCRICFGGHRYDKTYTDCFAPTVNFNSVLMVICFAAMLGWHLGSLDYSQAYLNADIDELCIMRAPTSLREYSPTGEELFWRLKKVIYGHPKGSRLWADCLHRKLLQLGFSQFLTDQCVYGKWDNWDPSNMTPDSTITIILVHSDDLIIASNHQSAMESTKKQLLEAFDGVDQGDLTSFCGVEIDRKEDSITLSMDYYWKKLLAKFNIGPDATEDSPIRTKVRRSECPPIPDKARKKEFLQIIGSILYGYTHCRLDLAYAVGMMTRVMHSPSAGHLSQLKHLLRYINYTQDYHLQYHRDHAITYGMDYIFSAGVDSSHADDEDTMRSTGGWYFFLGKGQGCVAAKSGQTTDVALSSTESETVWVCNAATQGAFMKQFIDELAIFKTVTFELLEDSQPAINAQKRNVSQSKFRHIKTKYHYVRQLIYEGWAKLVKISTKDQVADMATKVLSAPVVQKFTRIILGHSHPP